MPRLPAFALQGFELKRRGELKLIKVFQVGVVCWGAGILRGSIGWAGRRRWQAAGHALTAVDSFGSC